MELLKRLWAALFPPPPAARADEIAPGIPKPTTVLAHLLAFRVLAEPERLLGSRERKLSPDNCDAYCWWRSADRGIAVQFYAHDARRSDMWISVVGCTVAGQSVRFAGEDGEVLKEALRVAVAGVFGRHAAALEADRQMAALSMVEALTAPVAASQ